MTNYDDYSHDDWKAFFTEIFWGLQNPMHDEVTSLTITSMLKEALPAFWVALAKSNPNDPRLELIEREINDLYTFEDFMNDLLEEVEDE